MKAELKPQELRIGNLVTDEFYDTFKKVIVVESLNDKGINLVVENSDDYPEMQSHWIEPFFEHEKLRGIELSEEWLKRFGLTENDCVHGYAAKKLWEVDKYTIIVKCYDSYETWFEIRFTDSEQYRYYKIPYVHTLQNLYFALTNTELTLKETVS